MSLLEYSHCVSCLNLAVQVSISALSSISGQLVSRILSQSALVDLHRVSRLNLTVQVNVADRIDGNCLSDCLSADSDLILTVA